jgi:hypothetical protein
MQILKRRHRQNRLPFPGMAILVAIVFLKTEYVGMLISLWLFLFAAQTKDFLLGGLKKLENEFISVWSSRGNM